MALPIPTLDNRTFADLADEARSLIPALDPAWTNHNLSDPGITLVELFCWLTEMMIYSLDQITDQHRLTFLRLLNGPQWAPALPLDEEIGLSLGRIRGRFRAVTAADYEALALAASPRVKRTRCLARRNLDAGDETLREVDAPGHVSVVILPLAADADQAALCAEIRHALEPGRILTTRLHVVTPTFVPITTRMMVVRRSDVPEDRVAAAVSARLAAWLDPFTGGDGAGWPFGRALYVSELYAMVEHVAGVDYLGEVGMASTASDPLQPTAAPFWHDSGDLVGLALAGHELPHAPAGAHQIVVVRQLEPVRIAVTATPAPSATPPLVRRVVMETLKNYLWSLQMQAAAQQAGYKLSTDDIRTALLAAATVTAVTTSIGPVALEVAPSRLAAGAPDTVATFNSGEYLEPSCRVDIAASNAP